MKIAIIGASGTIGAAFLEYFLNSSEIEKLYLFSRSEISNQDVRIIHQYIDIEDEDSIEEAANTIPNHENLDYIIASTGILYTDNILPEKSIKDLSYAKFSKLYNVNTIGPALIGKHFIHKLSSNSRSIFAVLSARVGSISDNILGGWYSYRCSKAALNMLIKNFSIEARRKNSNLIVVGLHPGTVESTLSKPFSSNIRSSKIFSPEYSVTKMVRVLENLTYEDSGKLFAWDGSIIDF
jgi:NAD(P)-dependent dehydrogenase (short-subunit alcohol dehydrogenase family)